MNIQEADYFSTKFGCLLLLVICINEKVFQFSMTCVLKEREKEKLDEINKTFRGDERGR